MESTIMKYKDGTIAYELFEWIPDNMVDFEVYEPWSSIKWADDESMSPIRETERVVLAEKVIMNERFLCRMGWSKFMNCWLMSRYRDLRGEQ